MNPSAYRQAPTEIGDPSAPPSTSAWSTSETTSYADFFAYAALMMSTKERAATDVSEYGPEELDDSLLAAWATTTSDQALGYFVSHSHLSAMEDRYAAAKRSLEVALEDLEHAREPLRFISRANYEPPPPGPRAEEGIATSERLAVRAEPDDGHNHSMAWGFIRRGVAVAWALVLGSIFVAFGSWALMLAVLYLGVATFCLADYAAYRVGGTRWFLPPRTALIGTYGFAGLAVTMIIASF